MGSFTPSVRSILCMVDLSPAARALIDWTARLAECTGAELRLLHAIHQPGDPLHPTAEFERSGDLEMRRAESKAAIETLLPAIPLDWRIEVVCGDPVEAVAEYCRHHPIDLIVGGSLGITRFKRLFMGTIIERLARRVPCPLLVLRPMASGSDRPKRIGVCCDLSPEHLPLVRWGHVLSQSLDADLALLHAVESPVHADMIDPAAGPYGQVQAELMQQMVERLQQMAGDVIGTQTSLPVHLTTGPATDELPALVHRHAVDLVVIGVRHHSAIGKLIVGSTTETMLRKAHCHVLTVPAPMAVRDVGTLAEAIGPGRPPTGVVADPRYLAHRPAEGHVESHLRLASVYALLDRVENSLPLVRIPPRHATPEDLARVHSAAYIRQIQATARCDHTQLTPDTFACADSYETATLAAGGVMAAIDAVVAGKAANALVLARPPGHHAEAGRANGYCLFNNVAIGAQYARQALGLPKILIVDWDLHHGNGIQHLFEHDPAVLYFSTHQYPLFPGTGHLLETGRGRGEGYTINVPLRKGLHDEDFAYIYRRLLTPLACAFQPDLVLVAAGFDLHKKDPMGRMKLTARGFSALTRIVMEISGTCCQGRLVLVLEGGYHHQALTDSVQAVLEELCDRHHSQVDEMAAKANRRRVGKDIRRCSEVLKPYWRCFQEPAEERMGRWRFWRRQGRAL